MERCKKPVSRSRWGWKYASLLKEVDQSGAWLRQERCLCMHAVRRCRLSLANPSSSSRCWLAGAGSSAACSSTHGVLVEEEDGVQSGGERGVDVALDAVADHPACVRREFVAGDDRAVGGGILFRDDFDSGKEGARPERASLSACSAWLPLVMRMRRWRRARSASVSATPGSSSISCSAMERAKPQNALDAFLRSPERD